MKRLFNTVIKTSILAYVVFIISGISNLPLSAQDDGPTGYCIPKQYFDVAAKDAMYKYYYCYPDYYIESYGYLRGPGDAISYLKISHKQSSEVVLFNNSGDDFVKGAQGTRCYHYFGDNYDGAGQLIPGDEYVVETRIKGWQYAYSGFDYCSYTGSYYQTYFNLRLFIDWNRDGDWLDQVAGPKNEYVKWSSTYVANSYCQAGIVTFTFKVPDDVDPGKTRLRLTACGPYSYYPYAQHRANPCIEGYWYEYYTTGYSYVSASVYGETEDYLVEFIIPIKGTFPSSGDVLFANRDYDGAAKEIDGVMEAFPRPMVELRDAAQAGTYCQYEIRGPLPSSEVVYTGLDGNGNSKFDLSVPFSSTTPKIFAFSKSTGTYTTGNGEVKFPSGGEYYVYLQMWLPGKTDPKVMTKKFTVSWANDLSVLEINNPIKFYTTPAKPFLKKYSRGNIPLAAVYKNTGKKTVHRFNAVYTIWKAKPVYQGTKIVDYQKDGNPVRQVTKLYDSDNPGSLPLAAKQQTEIDFGLYNTQEVGKYIVEASCELLSGDDEETYNDVYPRTQFLTGEPNVWPSGSTPRMMFEVADEIEASAIAGIVPSQGSVMIANRPFFAVCDVQNNGVSDISNSKATIEFQHKTMNYKKSVEMIISDIPSGAYNRKTIKFLGESVILEHPGEYTATLTIKASGDVKTENDVITFSFTVESSVSGTFKVGTGQDFTTIQDAMDYLYLKGIDGNVNLVLTDAVYEIESPDELSPAWDLTTSIMGLGKQADGTINKLTIRASDERAVSRGGVTVRLKTKNGQGVVFGQRIVNNSKNAVVREELSGEQFRQYANSPGYIEFDGGSNKSLRFELYSTNKHHGSAFYLNRGSQNIKIQNVLIDNKTPELKNQVYIPHVFHSDADGFIFEKDSAASQSQIEGYSAGIASRSSLFDQLVVIFDEEGNPLENLPEVEGERRQIVLDTIPNSNNTFMNNEIKGFGYGIFTTGIGVLYYPPKSSYYRFYNSNNVIKNNIISEVGRSGIFAGYEENLDIRNNIIYNISGGGDGRGSGIQLGQSPRGKYKGYNNIGVKVIGNTIQDIRGSEYVNGIRIEQGITEFSDPTIGVIRFPNVKDDINVNSNGIWNIKPNLSQTERSGIYAFTQRLDDKNDYTKLTTPLYANKMIEDLKVTNNTILFNEDGLLNNGRYFGVGIQQSNNAIFANNAIAIEDKTSNSATIHSALFIQGDHPNHGFIQSDNNAYWVEGSGCDVIRFIESIPMTINNKVQTGFIHEGFNGEYQTIRQWRNWIGMDRHSSTSSNFMNNYSFVGTPSKLYMASPIPYASVLNNRGMRIDGDNVDMYGTKRGASGESFDIGAIEFNGIMYNLDNEIVDIEAPANYRESLGKYSGCEYVMTKAPVEIKSYLRNNGSLSQNSIPVTVKIERDDNGTMHEVLKETVTVNTPAYGYSDVYFNLANNEGAEFKPETYAELDKAIDDASFYGMEENVTPIYKITVTAGDDQNNINNVSTKYIRFFIERSHVGMLECNELLTSNLTSSNPTELAANLNAKAFEDGMRSIGYYNVTRKEAQTNKLNNVGADTVYVQNIDRFNRNSWPERSIDYTGYRTVIWTDGDNDRLTRYQAIALKNFVEAGSESDKNNLVVLSQEIIRNNEGLDIDYDFSSTVFHAQGKNPQSPLGVDVNGNYISYAGKSVTGVNVERNLSENIIATGVAGDSDPQPGLLSLVEGAGNTRVAYVYNEPTTAPESNRIMGIAHSRTDRNILLYAIDWRHFEDIESVLRATYDYLEKNGSNPVPVDLLSFDGKQVGNAIELVWSTASETNSSYFDVERRLISETDYKSLDKVEAAGNSSNILHYGMKDESVNFGNTYVYRLKLVEADGSFNYSNEATVKMESMKGTMSMSDIKPYPVSSVSTFDINLSSATTVKIEMFNTQGKSVGILFEGTLSGSTSFDVNASKYPAGVYSIVVTNGESTLTKSVHIIK